jgi:hypothetical protein
MKKIGMLFALYNTTHIKEIKMTNNYTNNFNQSIDSQAKSSLSAQSLYNDILTPEGKFIFPLQLNPTAFCNN